MPKYKVYVIAEALVACNTYDVEADTWEEANNKAISLSNEDTFTVVDIADREVTHTRRTFETQEELLTFLKEGGEVYLFGPDNTVKCIDGKFKVVDPAGNVTDDALDNFGDFKHDVCHYFKEEYI
jgi:hypothetical protein